MQEKEKTEEKEKRKEVDEGSQNGVLDCIMCGGFNTLIDGRNASGHFRGTCTQCGAKYIE